MVKLAGGGSVGVLESQDNSNTIDQKAASKKVSSSRELVTPGPKKGHDRLESKGVNNTKENTETKISKDLQVKECTDMYANKIHEPEEPDQLIKGNKYSPVDRSKLRSTRPASLR